MKIAVLDWNTNQSIEEVELPKSIAETEVKPFIISEVIRWQQARARAGTHMTKTKGLVRGGGKKPFKQKGTGNARQGSIRSPLMPGGGKIFGPVPRSYDYTLPKKIRKAALRMALKVLANENKLFVYNQIQTEGKTNSLHKKFLKFGIEKAVVLNSQSNHLLHRAVRNLSNFKFLETNGLNVEDILRYKAVVLAKEDLVTLETRIS